jgi:hypothetical protein
VRIHEYLAPSGFYVRDPIQIGHLKIIVSRKPRQKLSGEGTNAESHGRIRLFTAAAIAASGIALVSYEPAEPTHAEAED